MMKKDNETSDGSRRLSSREAGTEKMKIQSSQPAESQIIGGGGR